MMKFLANWQQQQQQPGEIARDLPVESIKLRWLHIWYRLEEENISPSNQHKTQIVVVVVWDVKVLISSFASIHHQSSSSFLLPLLIEGGYTQKLTTSWRPVNDPARWESCRIRTNERTNEHSRKRKVAPSSRGWTTFSLANFDFFSLIVVVVVVVAMCRPNGFIGRGRNNKLKGNSISNRECCCCCCWYLLATFHPAVFNSLSLLIFSFLRFDDDANIFVVLLFFVLFWPSG